MPADNTYANHEWLPEGPCRRAAALTPDNSNELPFVTRYIYVGGTGDVAVLTEFGDTVTFTAVPAGTQLRIAAKKVLTASSASSLVGMA